MIDAEHVRVLVTGGSGFIGTNLVESLREMGASVVNLDRLPPRNPAHLDVWRGADLRDASAVADVFLDVHPTHVVHLGARTDLNGTRLADYAANTDGVRHVIQAADLAVDPPRLVVASSRLVCRIGYRPRSDGDYCPPNAYGQSKVLTEEVTRRSDYRGAWTLVRPTSIWGPWFGTPYRTFFLAVAHRHYIHPAGVRILKSFGYVRNTVAQLVRLLNVESRIVTGRTFYLADYDPIEVFDFANRIRTRTGGDRVRTAPLSLLRGIATTGDALQRLGWRSVPLTRFRLENLLTEMLHDVTPIKQVLPELPVGLDDAIAQTVEWLRNTGDLPVR